MTGDGSNRFQDSENRESELSKILVQVKTFSQSLIEHEVR